MTLFWIGAVLISAIVALPFIFVASRRSAASGVSQLELNRHVFEQRQLEIKQQFERGEITEDEFQQLNLELQTNLLDDTEQMTSNANGNGAVWPMWGLFGLGVIAAVIMYVLMGNQNKVEQWQQSLEQMPALAERLMQPGDNPLSNEELELFALALRTNLNEKGDDAMGWLLFGRIQLSFGRLNEATEAFVNALHLQPDNKAANLSYAKALAMSGEPAKINYAKSIYQRLLATSPSDLDVLSEQAFTLFEAGERSAAFAAWQRMLEIIPADSPRHKQIAQTLTMLKSQQHGMNPHAQPAAEPVSEQAAVAAETTDEATDLVIDVTVSAEQGIDIPADSFLVVYARAVQGPPMPMAVKRMPMPSLPLTLQLTSADAMMENYALGAVEPFEVVARVVKGANVATADALFEAVGSQLHKQDLPTQVNLTLQGQ
ncbi:c-type cytochrome biogenesis protein CcmI [Neiella sp. HB171785]|uniref:C-type cytochrome biogenesis protein CcmI n=1 Tax=Neiella litorisoli TaxID=2771431 RepID=A0A8J6QUH0_9GAMM|nr:c-type cytochrome biogenesis protein CcmI [Neiella litorisoli]MBD1389827.1 c-type cytochrome biogenesis protein CcmI [Neiella litorisoli]